jgi:hypothetical protein
MKILGWTDMDLMFNVDKRAVTAIIFLTKNRVKTGLWQVKIKK